MGWRDGDGMQAASTVSSSFQSFNFKDRHFMYDMNMCIHTYKEKGWGREEKRPRHAYGCHTHAESLPVCHATEITKRAQSSQQ